MSSWSLHRAADRCEACGHRFATDETLFSLLRLRDEDGLARVDLCTSCFGDRDVSEDVSWWRTRRREHGGRALRVDFQALLGLLEGLVADGRDDRLDLAYLLALLLVRHRRLRLLRVERAAGRELLVLRKVRSTQAWRVPVRELDEDRRRSLAGALTELLGEADEVAAEGGEAAPDAAEGAAGCGEEPGGGAAPGAQAAVEASRTAAAEAPRAGPGERK